MPMPISRSLLASLAFAGAALVTAWPAAAELRMSKDVGPANVTCDKFGKDTAEWLACAGEKQAAMPDQELFYAGYWLAKTGKYKEALSFLTRAKVKDEKILTYIGFATRKLGDVDAALPFYAKALDTNPQYSVARAYLGEAFLTLGQRDKAVAQLGEIETRCGRTCVEYVDLATNIAAYDAKKPE